jgi:sodium/potassium-transporting ATPase subunit beta
MADSKPTILGGTAIKPKERKGWEAVRYLIHNPETGEFFTRTPKSWLLITVFYIIYYSCLAGFWAAMLNIFFLTLENHQPKWQNKESLIGVSPGVGLQPGQILPLIDSTMIAFNYESETDQGNPGDINYIAGWGGWAERSKKFLDKYEKTKETCKTSKTGCFDLAQLGACATAPYGFDKGTPCVFLKLNKIFGNTNDHCTAGDLDAEFLEDGEENPCYKMPESLKTHIKTQKDQEQVWIECHGEYPADRENLEGITYFPKTQGFPASFFPYNGKVDENGNDIAYQSPIVAVQFAKAAKNQLLHIECRAWAKNIGYSKRDRVGINHLELLVLGNEGAKKVGSGS